MKKGDVVLFIPDEKLPIPRGEIKMWTLGKVYHDYGDIVTVIDHCGFHRTIYKRFVQVINNNES